MQLLERDDQLVRLNELLAGAQDGHGSVVLVRGEAGVGKTTLVQQFLNDVADRAHLFWGACEDMVTAVPFGPLSDMARDDAELRRALEEGDRIATFQIFLDRLSRTLRPTVIVIEDAQWADAATLDLVRVIGRRASKTHGLLISAFTQALPATQPPRDSEQMRGRDRGCGPSHP